jgi:CheY-like chemotaxis protein
MTRGQFIEHLRTALMQLDDLQALRQNPLLGLFTQAGVAANPVHLQQLLFEGIEQVKEVDSPRAGHLYEILYYRYVEQGAQMDVAYQMGVSVRQLRREQNSAIELLAELLWARTAGAQEQRSDPALARQTDDALQGEISWLHEFQAEASDLRQEFERALENAALVAARYGVKLAAKLPPRLSPVAVPPMALRQALLTALTALISSSANTVLRIAVDQPAQTSLRVHLCQEMPARGGGAALQDRAMVHTVARLLAPFDAHIDLEEGDTLAITMLLPGIESIPVLLVDDNPDVRQLLQRYAANTRFRIVATGESEQAIPLVSEFGIQAIVVDIMMPGDDGWDLLARLRHHPATRDIPIAVCTILPQRELSLLLGANAFIQKPVEQTAFLNLLGQMVSS